MPVKFFSFGPDDHYAYPEISDFSETSKDLNIPDSDECLDGFVGASYSAIDLELDESDRPQEEDFETEEEFEDADDEWMQNAEGNAKAELFYDYGNYDVYERSFMIAYDDSFYFGDSRDEESNLVTIINDVVSWNMTGSTTIMEDMMEDLSKKDGINFIFSAPLNSGGSSIIAKDGEITELGGISSGELSANEELIKLVSDIIINKINDGDISNAGKIMSSTLEGLEGLDDYIKSQITPEQYSSLTTAHKSHTILGRFKK